MTDLYPDAAKAAVMTALNVPEAAVDTMNGRRTAGKHAQCEPHMPGLEPGEWGSTDD